MYSDPAPIPAQQSLSGQILNLILSVGPEEQNSVLEDVLRKLSEERELALKEAHDRLESAKNAMSRLNDIRQGNMVKAGPANTYR